MDDYGWDVVYACSGAFLNAELAASQSEYIQGFSYEDDAVAVSGRFGIWSIVPGGAGSLIRFETPIVAGSVVIKQTGQSIPLDGAVPLLQMQLALASPGAGQPPALKFNCTTVGRGAGDTTPGAVSVLDPDTSGRLQQQPNGAIAAALLVTGLANVMIQNAAELTFLFASLLPLPENGPAWLYPVAAAYCYQQPSDGTLGSVAVLGVLTPRDIDDLPRNIDATLLAHADFGYVLDGTQFLQNVIMPALPAAMGAPPGSFRLLDGVIVRTSNFPLPSVRVGLIDYTPVVQDFSMHIEVSRMESFVATQTDITGLADAYVTNSVTSNNESRFDVSTLQFSFLPDPNKQVTSNKYIPWWEEFLGVLTLGIMNAVIDGVSLAIENAAAAVVGNDDASAIGSVGPGLVQWHGQQAITVTAGGLVDNIYMQGDLN